MTVNLSRRSFLKSASAATAGAFVIGMRPDQVLATPAQAAEITPFIRISTEGRVTAVIKHFECGQGAATGLTTLIAEELNMPPSEIEAEFAPADNARYANLFFGSQATGGSTAMANSYVQYRTAGAAVREMLIAAAASDLGVEAGTLELRDGAIWQGDTQHDLGAFNATAMAMDVPAEPALKDPEDFRFIGNPAVGRLDNTAKTNGTAEYAMDVHLDGQVVAVVLRSPRFGGKLVSSDDSAAAGVAGFIRSVPLPTGAGVIVYGENTWAALQARAAIMAEWDFSEAESRSSDQIRDDLLKAVNSEPQYVAGGDADAVQAGLAGAAQVVEQDFYLPFLAHAPMEPLTCTIAPTETGVVIYDGCQAPVAAQGALSAVLQIPAENVEVRTLFAGGSFGRRFTPTADYHVEAALAFALNGSQSPVKLVWSREDDITGGYYRPAVAHKVRVGLDEAGRITGWDHRIATKSIMKDTAFEGFVVHNGVDHSSVEGVADTPYDLPVRFTGLTDDTSPVPVNWWRSVGHSHTAFVMESMMDMAAVAAGQDPVDYRLSYLAGGTEDQDRLSGVLRLAAEKAGWADTPGEGRARGVAVHKSFGSYVAEVVEISRDDDGYVKIEKVTCAVDCGLPVNPDVIRAQIESGVGYGIGHVMRDEITLTDGVVDQSNFPDYEPLRITDIGAIETHIVPSVAPPTGIGEPGTPPAGPALANAMAALGARITYLPMVQNGADFI